MCAAKLPARAGAATRSEGSDSCGKLLCHWTVPGRAGDCAGDSVPPLMLDLPFPRSPPLFQADVRFEVEGFPLLPFSPSNRGTVGHLRPLSSPFPLERPRAVAFAPPAFPGSPLLINEQSLLLRAWCFNQCATGGTSERGFTSAGQEL